MSNELTLIAEICSSSEQESAAALKVLSIGELANVIIGNGSQVVLTKGVFDILHRGHIHLISFCLSVTSQCTRGALVVAVEADDSVALRKGSRRPINPKEDRSSQIAAIPGVDYVVTFRAGELAAVIESIRPVVYVKGQDTALDGRVTKPGSTAVLSASDNNSELHALLKCGGKLIVYSDNGAASTTKVISRVLERYTGRQ